MYLLPTLPRTKLEVLHASFLIFTTIHLVTIISLTVQMRKIRCKKLNDLPHGKLIIGATKYNMIIIHKS